MFAFYNFCAIFFMYFYVPETKGLLEADKKKLFYPGAKWGRKLKEGETMPYPITEGENVSDQTKQ